MVPSLPELPTILIADDDAIFLGITASMVKTLGYPVITAPDGAEALELFKKNADNIGCVLLDLHMPKMSGILAFHQIRKLRENVLVIIVSGCLTDVRREQLAPLRPTSYLEKPVTFDVLSEVLSASLASSGSAPHSC